MQTDKVSYIHFLSKTFKKLYLKTDFDRGVSL